MHLCNVLYYRHVKVVSKKRRTLHNVKASSMLCQLDNWNLRNSNCVPNDNVRSECYRYAILYPGVCSEGYMPSRTLFGYMHIPAWADTSTRHTQGQSQGLNY